MRESQLTVVVATGAAPRRGAEDVEIVAYCRGPLCVYSPQAVRVLRRHGRRDRHLEDGFPEWRIAGLPIEGSASA